MSAFLISFEAFEVEMLFALEFVGAVASCRWRRPANPAGFLDEFDGFLRIGVMAARWNGRRLLRLRRTARRPGGPVRLRRTQLCLWAYSTTLLADLDVLLERLVAGVNHHAGEPFVNALLAQLEGVAVVQVDGDGDVGQADGGLDEFLEINRVGVLARALGNLEHQRRLFLFAGLDDGLDAVPCC